jgi:HEPN domain-containing protein
MSAPESNYQAWLAKAENDLLNIRNNLQAPRVPWDTVCFHAQRAAEKFLKGFLVYPKQMPTRTHDLVALLARCVEIQHGLVALEEDCRKLTYYAVGSRYPEDLFQPNENEALQLVSAANRVRDKILRLLRQP